MSDATDRALEQALPGLSAAIMAGDYNKARAILTDLDAEIRKEIENAPLKVLRNTDHSRYELYGMLGDKDDEIERLQARLAAVVAKCQAAKDFADEIEPDDILALARGEGGDK